MKQKVIVIGMSLLMVSTMGYAKDMDTQVQVVPNDTTCIINNPCLVRSNHSAEIRNYTNQTKVFLVTYQICPDAEDCKRDRYRITVAPNSHWFDNKTMAMTAKYHYAGDRYLYAETILTELNGTPVNQIKKAGKILVHG